MNVKTLFFTFPFAEKISVPLYNQIAAGYPDTTTLLGEWIFAHSLFGSEIPDAESYIDDVLRGDSHAARKIELLVGTSAGSDSFIRQVRAARDEVESFLTECVNKVNEYHPEIVGFTSSFQQHLASLSLAKRIKAQAPETFVLFGGANCEGAMGAECINQFPFVDALVSGEGDDIFPVIVERVLEKESIAQLQGVYTHNDPPSVFGSNQFQNTPAVRDLDSLPFPDYSDFFDQLQASGLGGDEPPRLLFETSRGCWWGEKKHCTFCGLNGSSMAYRSKSARRALDELYYLTNKYPKCPVEVVDNILNMKYFDDFIPELAARRLDLEMFYEVKANLKKEQVRLLRDAGIREIQPGIESLSSEVLTLMRKGVSSIQNIQMLKWCKEFGIRPYWNLIWGFPGESPEEYRNMAELIPFLTHLRPPEFVGPLRLDRFSPNFNLADDFGFVDVQPYPAYNYIYPFPKTALANLAYYFTFNYRKPQGRGSHVELVEEQVNHWKDVHDNSDLISKDFGSYLIICDFRPVASEQIKVLVGAEKSIYTLCDRSRGLGELALSVEKSTGDKLSDSEVDALLQPLIEQGLMVKEGNRVLSLAIPVGEYVPRKSMIESALETNEAASTIRGQTGNESAETNPI